MSPPAGAARPPHVFTIPPGAPFLPTVAEALLGGVLVPGFSAADGPLGLAAATVFVPTRRSARALAAVLAERIGGPSILLPRILPLGDLDTMETELLFDGSGLDDPFGAGLPDAIGDTARRMILTRLILQWARQVRRAIISVAPDGSRTLHPHEELLVATSAADAWALSADLAALSDDLAAEGIDWSRVMPLGTDRYDRYWRITLDFLGIVMTNWPAILRERGEVDGVTRRTALIEAEIARLERGGAAGPVVVAGSTGSNPAVSRLIACISRLPRGAVVLPGLDLSLDDVTWRAVAGADVEAGFTHPQSQLQRLLAAAQVDRAEVVSLGRVSFSLLARERFVGEALRPADTTDQWRLFAAAPFCDLAAALDAVAVIEAADEREEALALAIALREALEGPGTAVLVTPDRALGRRVREDLARWGIEIDESGGEPLGTTPAGAFARLVLDCALGDLAPVEVLALLAHPLARFGRPRAEVVALARTLEIAILRGVLPPRALHDPAGLIERARAAGQDRHAPRALAGLKNADFERLAGFLAQVTAALKPIHALGPETPLPDWLAAHEAVIDAIALGPDGTGVISGIDGNVLAGLFLDLRDAPEAGITLDCPGYGALFDRFAAETTVRGPDRSHPRLKILGLLEARLIAADLVLLGGLDETIWPPQNRTDAFLNRPMRASLGLAPPERRIGQTAHDLSMLLGQARVVLSRSRKRGGSPMVPSRFLLRMQALAGEHWTAGQARGRRYVDLARAVDQPTRTVLIARPSPKPPVDWRPTSLSVTRIETLRRDPYAIYAERILKLAATEPIGAVMGPREYGTMFHGVISEFTRLFEAALPPQAGETLFEMTDTVFEAAQHDVAFRTFVWPRIQGWARGFLAWETGRRAHAPTILVEERGTLPITLADGSTFKLTAYADRIESTADGRVTLIDFKTGVVPTAKTVRAGFAPQLSLEAAMVERGGFTTLGTGALVEAAAYVKLEAGEAVPMPLAWKDRSFAEVVAEHFDGLVDLLNTFRDPGTGYPSRPYPQYASRYGDYDHLARVKEWTLGGGGDEE